MKGPSFILQGLPGSPGNVGPAGKEGPVVSIAHFPLHFQEHLLHPHQVYFCALFIHEYIENKYQPPLHHLGTEGNRF